MNNADMYISYPKDMALASYVRQNLNILEAVKPLFGFTIQFK